MFNNNTFMLVGGGLIVVSILTLNYNLLVSVPIFTVGAYFAFFKAPRTPLDSTPSGEQLDEKPLKVSRNSRCPCGSRKRYKNCCQNK